MVEGPDNKSNPIGSCHGRVIGLSRAIWKDWTHTHKTGILITAGRLRANNDDLCLRVDRVDYHFTHYLVDIRVAVLSPP